MSCRLEGLDTVTVKVGSGSEAKVWKLPMNILKHVSPYFRAALSPPWSESATGTIELHDDDPVAFRLFLRWLFNWTLGGSDKPPKEALPAVEPMASLHAWILGDKLLCPRFQDYAMAHLWYNFDTEKREDAAVIGQAYRNTLAGSGLRRWAANECLEFIEEPNLRLDKDDERVQLMDEIDGLAVDVVKLRMLHRGSAKTMTPFLLVSSHSDYISGP
ncbi:MAG: hypothetical protein Q9222_005774 [Ikaeria aurantiellina]